MSGTFPTILSLLVLLEGERADVYWPPFVHDSSVRMTMSQTMQMFGWTFRHVHCHSCIHNTRRGVYHLLESPYLGICFREKILQRCYSSDSATVYVGMSGGVDSTVTALLLKEQVRPGEPSIRNAIVLFHTRCLWVGRV